MSRHECIKMFNIVVELLVMIAWKIGLDKHPRFEKWANECENFMGELTFKDGND